MRLCAPSPAPPSPGLRMAGVVEAAEFLGEVTRYRVRVGSHALTVDQTHAPGSRLFAPGETMHLMLEPGRVRLLPRA